MLNIQEYINLNNRCKELIDSIKTINNYEGYLRDKYYPVLIHEIELLKQYTIMLDKGVK